MLQDISQEYIQALRSVNRGIPPNSIPPASPDEIYHVVTQHDPDTQKEFIFWEDIVQAFDNAVQVRDKTRVISFLTGNDNVILEPLMIAAVPNTVLDVVVDTSATQNLGVNSPHIRQLELQQVPSQDHDSTIKVEIASQDAISTPSATSTSINAGASAPSTAASALRRNPVYGLVEIAMENYTHIDRPLAFPLAPGPQAVLDDRALSVEDPPTAPRPDNNSGSELPRPRTAATDVLVEVDVSAARRNPVYGLVEIAMENYTHIDRPLPFPSARGPQAVLDDHMLAVEDLPTSPRQDDDSRSQLRSLNSRQLMYLWRWMWRKQVSAPALGTRTPRLHSVTCTGMAKGYRRAKRLPWTGTSSPPIRGTMLLNTISANFIKRAKVFPRIFAKAVDWFSKTADRGHNGAKRELEILEEEGVIVN